MDNCIRKAIVPYHYINNDLCKIVDINGDYHLFVIDHFYGLINGDKD